MTKFMIFQFYLQLHYNKKLQIRLELGLFNDFSVMSAGLSYDGKECVICDNTSFLNRCIIVS